MIHIIHAEISALKNQPRNIALWRVPLPTTLQRKNLRHTIVVARIPLMGLPRK
jgi:hypothetical protein